MTARLRPRDVVVFLGPSLPADEARGIAPCRVLPPARAGDVLAVLPSRPLAVALVDGLFDTTPSVWHHELLAALDAGVAVFGAASMGALRAAELAPFGVVGVGAVHRAYRDGELDDDAVALLHAGPEHGWRPFTVPLVSARAAAEAARAAGVLSAREARAVVSAAEARHYTSRTWRHVLDDAGLGGAAREGFLAFLPRAPDPKAEDARACVAAAAAFARARRAGAPAPPPPALPVPSHVRRARLVRARAGLPSGAAVAAGDVVAALAARPDAGRLAADGLRRALAAALARSLGYAASPAEGEAALAAWLDRAGVPARRRDAFLEANALDEGAARRLGEDLALEARLLADAARVVPDGPSWEEGLALGARLSGVWLEEALTLMGKREKTPPPPKPSAPFHSAFAQLRDRLPEGWTPPAAPAPPAPAAPDAPARAVVRLERKGRGGKEATVVEKLALPPGALAAWADALKRSLGCGGGVEGDAIALQGDQRERARAWLEGKGVRKVTVS